MLTMLFHIQGLLVSIFEIVIGNTHEFLSLAASTKLITAKSKHSRHRTVIMVAYINKLTTLKNLNYLATYSHV